MSSSYLMREAIKRCHQRHLRGHLRQPEVIRGRQRQPPTRGHQRPSEGLSAVLTWLQQRDQRDDAAAFEDELLIGCVISGEAPESPGGISMNLGRSFRE